VEHVVFDDQVDLVITTQNYAADDRQAAQDVRTYRDYFLFVAHKEQ
jgi:hypothetical protein